jgi:GntR family transcriptional repressor for pyruvate dehydrogenase complex
MRIGLRLQSVRLADQLAERLQRRIDTGEWRPQVRLPTEQALAEEHGVSRTVVREAVSRLKSTGLLVSRQGSGVYVAAAGARRALAFDPSVLGSLDAVVQVVEVRRALESEAAALAATRASDAELSRIQAALEAVDLATAAGRDGVAEDMHFHRCIAAAAGNPQFTRVLAFLEQYQHDAMAVTRANESLRPAAMQAVRREHHAIVSALLARDPQRARRAAAEHMRQATRRIERADAPVRLALDAALRKDRS